MTQVKPGTKITLDDMEVVVVELLHGEHTIGLLNTETYAVIYVFDNITELVEQLSLLGYNYTIH